MNKNIYEGWTAQHFIDDLDPLLNLIMTGRAITKPFTSKKDLQKWLTDNQPYYKKPIPKVTNHFAERYNLK